MKKNAIKKIAMLFLLMGAGCAMNDSDLQRALSKNPDIVFKTIEDHPERFIEVVNVAAKKAQEAAYQKRLSAQIEEQEKALKNPLRPELKTERRLFGSDSGKVVVVEYGDFQCPACRMAHSKLKEFKDKYKDQVQFYYKHMPLDFHPQALPAARYFEALRLQDKQKAAIFYEELFSADKDLSEKFFKEILRKIGADMKRIDADIKSQQVKNSIAADMVEFQKFGFTGTPTILLNGVPMEGVQTLEALEQLVQKTLK